MITVAALAGAALLIAAGLAWTARLVHVGNLDALALAEKTAIPEPVSALDWPELRLRAVIPQPGEPSVLILLVEWPARQRAASLLVALDTASQRSAELLPQWCAERARVSPTRRGASGLELRRRQSLARVGAFLLAEDAVAGLAWPEAG